MKNIKWSAPFNTLFISWKYIIIYLYYIFTIVYIYDNKDSTWPTEWNIKLIMHWSYIKFRASESDMRKWKAKKKGRRRKTTFCVMDHVREHSVSRNYGCIFSNTVKHVKDRTHPPFVSRSLVTRGYFARAFRGSARALSSFDAVKHSG